MKRYFLIVLSIIFLTASCSKEKIIPKDTLSQIYYDIYMSDQYISSIPYQERKAFDTLLVYEPIFNKYGYTTEDYLRSTTKYLARPGKFAKVFKKTQEMLTERSLFLERTAQLEKRFSSPWGLVDSLDLYGSKEIGGNAYYRYLRMLFFQADTLKTGKPELDSSLFEALRSPVMLYDKLPSTDDGFVSPVLPPLPMREPLSELDSLANISALDSLSGTRQFPQNTRPPSKRLFSRDSLIKAKHEE